MKSVLLLYILLHEIKEGFIQNKNSEERHILNVCTEASVLFPCPKRLHKDNVVQMTFFKVLYQSTSLPDQSILMRQEMGAITVQRPRVGLAQNENGFYLNKTKLSDAGCYDVEIHYKDILDFDVCPFELRIIDETGCPNKLKYNNPRVSLIRWNGRSVQTPLWSDHLSMKRLDNIVISVEIPKANPPVNCFIVASNKQNQTCNGTIDRDTYCRIELSFQNIGMEYMNTTLSFVAYESSSTKTTFNITDTTPSQAILSSTESALKADVTTTPMIESDAKVTRTHIYVALVVIASLVVPAIAAAACIWYRWRRGKRDKKSASPKTSQAKYQECPKHLSKKDSPDQGGLEHQHLGNDSHPAPDVEDQFIFIIRGDLENAKDHFRKRTINKLSTVLRITPLSCAVGYGHIHIAEHFLEQHADPNLPNTDGRTPLHVSADLGRIELFKLLLKAGADLNKLDFSGRTSLYGKLAFVHSIVNKRSEDGHNLNDTKVNNEAEAFHEAAKEGDIEVIQYLVDNGFDLTMKDAEGKTALDIAVLHKREEIIEYLKARRNKPT